jgi:hypothetical protein
VGVLPVGVPVGPLRPRRRLRLGTADALTTPADVAESRAQLPTSTVFSAVDGGIHGYFGDYGYQPGDGSPGVDRATAQQQMVAATTAFMSAVAADPDG